MASTSASLFGSQRPCSERLVEVLERTHAERRHELRPLAQHPADRPRRSRRRYCAAPMFIAFRGPQAQINRLRKSSSAASQSLASLGLGSL
jgi:hypothetical protein